MQATPRDDLKKYKVFGIGIVPLMIIIFTITMIVIAGYEWFIP